jgi:hypothetical protein
MTSADADILNEEVERIVASGVLGRSRTYAKLLEYLVGCSLSGRAPKEIEIAAEVFGKGAEFDPNQDSLVRVYMHNLRQKLEQYASQHGDRMGYRLSIPRGEYRLVVEAFADDDDAAAGAGSGHVPVMQRRSTVLLLGVVALLLLGNLFAIVAFRDSGDVMPLQRVAESSVWAGFFDDDVPLLVVVGDYYIFAELDDYGRVDRLVRDFSINSAQDLDDLFMYSPELAEEYYDLDLTYLPQASAFALADVLRVVYTSDKPVRITPMSELSATDLKNNHIIYVGYISALDMLNEFVFATSGLTVGETYDELRVDETGELFTSGAGMPRYDHRNYRDYGLVSAFPGPSGNQFLIVAGTRDEGVMQAAQALTDSNDITELTARTGEAPAFEALYEVTGFDRMNLHAMLVYAASLNGPRIWGGASLQ